MRRKAEAALESQARRRAALHASHPSHRPLSPDYERVGLVGERDFGRLVGQQPDARMRAGGDCGYDFVLALRGDDGRVRRLSVNVKTARKPYYLLVEQGSKPADIYVLMRYRDEQRDAVPVGWQWGAVVLRWPVRDFGRGVFSHYGRACDLRGINQLIERLA